MCIRDRDHGTMDIYIKTLTGQTYELRVNPTMIVEEIKYLCKDISGIPLDQQRMIFNGKQLEDRVTLKDYKIENESTINLVLRLRGGGWAMVMKIFRKDQKKMFKKHAHGEMTCLEFKTAVSQLSNIPLKDLVMRPDIFQENDKKLWQLNIREPELIVFPKSYKPSANFGQLTKLVILQNVKGLWSKEKEVEDLLEVKLSSPPAEIIEKCGNEAGSVWLTIVVLYFLQNFYGEEKGKWSLIATKSQSYLDLIGISAVQYFEAASALFQNS
eukprot:TRINITY_DN13219_c0_g1_i1.p1 TRINITY_DN13219_c0_g1~~TRINITY_DN13219_c0_g1_i1.p1  ORF type:complete len:270 (-),score=68.02 TRINITY_DN13219_c0_g1_i1:110-919(-)